MKTCTTQFRPALLWPTATWIALCGILFVSNIEAQQDRIQLPQLPALRGMDMGVIMEGTMFSSGSNASIQMSIEHGIKKIHAVEDGVKTYIEEDPSGSILVRITKQYGPEEMDLLMEEHPGLYMSAKDFPTETEDAESVEVSIGVTKKYEAASVELLKENHPVAFEAYEKYSGGNPRNIQIFRGRFGRDLLMPEIRIAPEFWRTDPPEIQTDSDDSKKKQDSGKKDKDT